MFAREIGSGTPVVLLHGFGVDHRLVLPLEPAFERSGGWRRIYLDLPGATGSPDATVGSTQEVAEAVAAEIRSRVGSEEFAILGSSFGGMIARYVAHELRDRVLGLATIAGVFVADRDDRDVPERVVLHRDPAVADILGDALEDYRTVAVVESPRSAAAFLDTVLPGLRGADRAALERIARNYALDRQPEEAHPAPFVQPTLHVTARQDDVVGYRDAWARIEHYPRATFAALDGSGHNLLLERPDLAIALVTDWLARIRDAGRAGDPAAV